ncbi:MAG: ABC transporter permease subunit [Lachnospiraceae bacterium]|nr:ABC transporter permease subunit [Lachnospiraceae bacterium]
MSKANDAAVTGAKVRKTITNIIVHVILAILAFIWVLPIFWVVLTSFRGEKGSYVTTFFPQTYTINNYVKLFKDTTILNFPRMFMNTFVIAIFTCIISTIFVLSVSYCMSRMRFKMRRPFMNIAMVLGLFPGFMSMVAVYYILKALNMSEGSMIPIALVVVFSAGTGLGFYVAKGFFDTIPKSLDEAAIIDGATRWKIFTNVTIPLSKPIIVYTILTSFMSPWIDFLFAKVICRADAKYYTVSIGLWKMLEKEYIDNWYTSFAAGAVLVSIPIAILFLMTQKFYVEGMSGAVKG